MPILYASGYMGISLVSQAVVTWLMFCYCPPAGSGRTALLSAATFGLVMAIGRLADAVADPIIAVWSDNTRTRIGRRRPFIIAGAIPMAICFVMLWLPPAGSPASIAIYLAVVLGLLFAAVTAVACPFLALLPEVAASAEARLRVSSLMALFYMAGLGVGTVGSSLLIEHFGVKVMALTLGGLAVLSLLGPVLSVREQPAPTVGRRTPAHLALKTVASNPAFIPYICAQPFFWFGFNLILMGVPYIVTLQLGLPTTRTGPTLLLALAVAVVCLPVVSRTSARWGKKWTFFGAMVMCLLLVASLPLVGRSPVWLPSSLRGSIVAALAGVPLAGLFVLPNALVADIAGYGYSLTGVRQEALYFGIQGLVLKGTVGLSALVLGVLLERFGYAMDAFGGVLMIGPVAALSIAIGLVVFIRYPLRY